MVKDGVVFPGQGSQRPGMALPFVASFAEARAVFARAAGALPFDPAEVIAGDEARLNLTEFTQPCILTAEIAMFEVLRARHGFAPAVFGGHSLGEYAALVAAGALPLETALRLVHLRGRLMQAAVPAGEGAMAALICNDLPAQEIGAQAAACGVDLANDNSPEQVVLSGKAGDVSRAIEALQSHVAAGLRVVPLAVSAPFHSRWMAPIEPEFREALEAARPELAPERAVSVASNWRGGFHGGTADELIEALTRQISGTVRWRDNMAALTARAGRLVEVGPNRPLRGFFKALGVEVAAVVDVRSAEKTFGTAKERT